MICSDRILCVFRILRENPRLWFLFVFLSNTLENSPALPIKGIVVKGHQIHKIESIVRGFFRYIFYTEILILDTTCHDFFQSEQTNNHLSN